MIGEVVTYYVEKPRDILCNRCGQSCALGPNFEAAEIVRSHGYGSVHDGLLQRWHLCDDCLTTVRAEWALPPEECQRMDGERLPDTVWTTFDEGVAVSDDKAERARRKADAYHERVRKVEKERDRIADELLLTEARCDQLAAENAGLLQENYHLLSIVNRPPGPRRGDLSHSLDAFAARPRTRTMLAAYALAEAIRGREDVTVPTTIARGVLREYERTRAEANGDGDE